MIKSKEWMQSKVLRLVKKYLLIVLGCAVYGLSLIHI